MSIFYVTIYVSTNDLWTFDWTFIRFSSDFAGIQMS